MIRTCVLAAYLAAVFVCQAVEPGNKKAPPRAVWPPKAGVKTPGIQIPMANLKAEAEIALPGFATGLAFAADKTYVAVRDKDGLLPVVSKTNAPEDLVTGVQRPCAGIVSAFGGIWGASCGEAKLSKLDAKSKKITASVPVGAADLHAGIAFTADSLWLLSDARTTLSRVDPEENRVTAEVRLPVGCNSIISAENALWVTCPKEDKVLRVHPQTNLIENRVEVAGEPIALTSGEGSIWVLTRREGKVTRIDPKTNKTGATVELKAPGDGGTMAFGEGAIWVSLPDFPINRIDPATDKVAQQFAGEEAGNIFFGGGSLWLASSKSKVLRRFDPKRIRATLAE